MPVEHPGGVLISPRQAGTLAGCCSRVVPVEHPATVEHPGGVLISPRAYHVDNFENAHEVAPDCPPAQKMGKHRNFTVIKFP